MVLLTGGSNDVISTAVAGNRLAGVDKNGLPLPLLTAGKIAAKSQILTALSKIPLYAATLEKLPPGVKRFTTWSQLYELTHGGRQVPLE